MKFNKQELMKKNLLYSFLYCKEIKTTREKIFVKTILLDADQNKE